MHRLRRPAVWFPLALLLLAGAGAALLAQPACTPLTDRAAEYFLGYEYARCGFDALSAACGAGLLTRELGRDYTPVGRWVLTGVGLAGALLWLTAVTQALRRMGASLTIWAAPPVSVVLSLFLAMQIVLAAGLAGLWRAIGAPGSLLDGLRIGVAAFTSSGLVEPGAVAAGGGALVAAVAVFAWVSALGWPMWLFLIPALNRRHIQARHALVIAGTFTAWLLLLGALAFVLELPRSGVAVHGNQPAAEARAGYGQRLAQVTTAAGAGIAVAPLHGGELRDGSKLALSAAVLVGSAGYAPGGGITWILLVWALVAVVFGGPPRGRQPPHFAPWLHAGLSSVVALGLLALGGAAGLLAIENLTGSRFEHPATLADALLEASSAVGGANLTSGLTRRITAENLTGGFGLEVNLFPLGMGWLALLMLAGRTAPLLMLQRVADAVTPEPPRAA